MHALANNLLRVKDGFTRKVYAGGAWFVPMLRDCPEIETAPDPFTLCQG